MGFSKKAEFLVGFFVLLGALALIFLALNVSNIGGSPEKGGYQVKAYFDNIGGLRKRAQVTMSGVNIGRVVDVSYDKETFQAVVTLQINANVDYLPSDTQASIYTAGLLGEQYISLEPGAEDINLVQDDVISMTQSAIVLEEIIGKVLVSLTSK